MNLNQYLDGSKFIDKFDEDEFLKKNIVSKREKDLLTSTYLLLKICFFLLALVSLFKIVNITQLRIARLKEIKDSFVHEENKFKKLTYRFDNLLSLEGQQRFMKDQDQMISRDVIRVIWR